MRDNKFKVWCKDKKEWEKDYCVLNSNGILFHSDRYGGFSPLKPETHIAVFYTGLKDKNGVEIYEGDVCEIGIKPTEEEPDDEKCKVEVRFSKGQFWITYYGFPLKSYACNELSEIEVIGNIYSNPELLEGK